MIHQYIFFDRDNPLLSDDDDDENFMKKILYKVNWIVLM